MTAAALGFAMIAAGPAAADPNPTVNDAFDVVGTSHIGSINADLPIGPTELVETYDLVTSNILAGTLPIPARQVQFNALGLVPVRATTTLTQTSPITGTIRPGTVPRSNAITANVSYDIQLSDVSAQIFGVWTPLFVGNHCHTASPASITVATPPGQTFNVVTGGTVTGTYTIGNFTGCNALFIPGVGSLIINALVPGSDNTISLQLSNGHYVP